MASTRGPSRKKSHTPSAEIQTEIQKSRYPIRNPEIYSEIQKSTLKSGNPIQDSTKNISILLLIKLHGMHMYGFMT